MGMISRCLVAGMCNLGRGAVRSNGTHQVRVDGEAGIPRLGNVYLVRLSPGFV